MLKTMHAQSATESSLSGDEQRVKSTWDSVWQESKGMLFILLAEFLGCSMDAAVRLLETTASDGNGMHPLQLLFARMSITLILSSLYMWWKEVPDFPLGPSSVHGWLMLRAIFGFVGVYALYYAVQYLPLAEAIVLRLLIPIMTSWACSVFLNEAFTKRELIAGITSLFGVVMIAHPAFIFGDVDNSDAPSRPIDVSPTQRLVAIVVSLLGIVGGSGAYTIIRVIGQRAHALLSVSYFAGLTTVASALSLLTIPGIDFKMPSGLNEWLLLISLGIMGFFMQFLLTAGLQLGRSNKNTSMMYSQVLFALMFDWAIWGVLPGLWSIIGGLIVIISTLWVALEKTPRKPSAAAKSLDVDEASALLGTQGEGVEEAAV